MHKRFLFAASALAILAGCGGGGGSSIAGGGPAPAPEAAPVGSAKFTVDARTGEVKVEPLSSSRAAFSGGALSFTSSLLLSEGSPERRVLRVTAKNNTQETIGVDGTMRLLFTNFQNVNTPLTDLRSLVQTSTIWGNGTATTTFGGQTTATIQSPRAIHFDEASETLYASDINSQVLAAKGGTVSRHSTASSNVAGIAVGPGFVLETRFAQVFIKLDGLPIAALAGLTPGNVDGDFATARFSDVADIYMIRATGPNDFEAVLAEANRLRLIRRTPSFPNGNVTTLTTLANPILGVTYKEGVYYCTSGNFVVVFANGQTASIGNAASGYVDGIQTSARFNSPAGIRWVGSSLFVADTLNNRIRQMNLRPGGNVLSPNNWWVSTVSGNGTFSGVDGTSNFMTHANPFGITKGPGETLFVADLGGHRIRRITPISNRFLNNFGDSTANPADTAQLINATDYVPSDRLRTPLIFENQSIRAGESATLTEWQFVLPEGLKSFSFIVTVEAETGVSSILPAVSNTGSGTRGSTLVSVRTLTGSVSSGTSDGSAANAAFQGLRSICFSAVGDAFVTDHVGSTIRHIARNGTVKTILSAKAPVSSVDGSSFISSINAPLAIACNPEGTKIYFTEPGVVRLAARSGGSSDDPNSWTVTTIAGLANSFDNVLGSGQTARFGSQLYGLAYIDDNNIVISDSIYNSLKRITKVSPGSTSANYNVSSLAGNLSGAAGTADGTGSFARFDFPTGLAVSKSGYLIVADTNNARVRRVDSGGIVNTFAGSGAYGSQDATSPLSATFAALIGVSTDPSGYSYVSDQLSYQIRRLSPTGIATTVAGNEFSLGTADGTGATSEFGVLWGLAVAPGGDVWVLESTRIRILQRIITN